MSGIFSFIQSPIRGVLERAHQAMPNIEKVFGVWYDENEQDLRKMLAHRIPGNSRIEDLTSSLGSENFEKFRMGGGSTSWFSKEEIPFFFEKEKDSKKDIKFKELENTVLLLRFHNKADNKYDLLFYYFNSDTSNFGVSFETRDLTTEHKVIIGHMLFNSVRSQINDHENNRQKLKEFNRVAKNAIQENQKLKEELDDANQQHREVVGQLCDFYVKEVSAEFNALIKLAPSAKEKLIAYKGDLQNIIGVIREAASFVLNLNMGEVNDAVIIDESMLNTSTVVKDKVHQVAVDHQSVQEHRLETTEGILDDMEVKATELRKEYPGIKITGRTLGGVLSNPKSPSGITDQLNNHRKRIIRLFEENPNKWQMIRNHFKPIQNIINK